MKSLFVVSALAFAANFAFAEPLAQQTSPAGQGKTLEAKILSLYKKEATKQGSALNTELKKIKEENEIPEYGSVSLPTKRDLWLISNGRSGPGTHAQSYLLAVPVSWKGSGLIEAHLAYIEVNVQLHLEETDTIVLEKFVKLVDRN